MPWYLHHALKQLFPTSRRLTFFALVSICGVALGVTLLVVVLSLMNGFRNEIEGRIVNAYGHIRVTRQGGVGPTDDLLRKISQVTAVQATAPYSGVMTVIQNGRKAAFPYVRGIDPDREALVVPLERMLVAGKLADLDDDSIILGAELASLLQVHIGDGVEVFPPRNFNRDDQAAIFLPRSVRVAGILLTGWSQVDSGTALCTLRLMRDLQGPEPAGQGVTVRLRAGEDAAMAADRLNQLLPADAHAGTWLESNRDLLSVLDLEKNVLFFLLFFIELVAAFAIAGSLLFAVVRKTREIGVLAALGARPGHIAASFCLQGLLVGILGTTCGVPLALLSLHYRGYLLQVFTHLTQNQAALARLSQSGGIPVGYSAHDFTLVILSTLLISTLAGILPAVRAARLKPAAALRND